MTAIESLRIPMNTVTERNDVRHSTPKPGDPFNPWRRACGFYPPAFVSRLRHVVIPGSNHRLGNGHKNLYTLLVRRWGQEGPCFPGQESLAFDLGCSPRQVKVWIADLEAFGLIRYRRRGRGNGGRGLTNEYTFLWHPIFEVQPSVKRRFSKCETDSFEVRKAVVLKCEDQRPLYKEETRSEETCTDRSSSSSGEPKRMRDASNVESTTTTLPFFEKNKTQNAPWWTPEELSNANRALARHGTQCSSGSNTHPDSALTTKVLSHFSNFAEFSAWLGDLQNRISSDLIRTWGFYVADAQTIWPERRAEVEAQVAAERQRELDQERARHERERERQEREELVKKCRAKNWKRQPNTDCKRCAGYGCDPDTEQICSCEAGKQFEHEATKCPRCDHSGFVTLSEDVLSFVEWCDCQHGLARQKKEPDLVERFNSTTRKFLSMGQRSRDVGRSLHVTGGARW